MNDSLPDSRPMRTPGPSLLRRLQRLSLNARLGLGFGLIAILFLLANYASEQHAASVAAQIERRNDASRSFDRAARDLTDALGAYHDAVRASVGLDPGNASGKSLANASNHLEQAVREYSDLRWRVPDSIPGAELAQAIHALQSEVGKLLDTAQNRDVLMTRYWHDFERLQERFRASRSSSWHLGDRIVTRQSLVASADLLATVGNAVTEHFAAPTAQRAANIDTQERKFRSALRKNSKALIAAQGAEWYAAVVADFGQLQQLQRSARAAKASVDADAGVVASAVEKLFNLIDSGVNTPAAKALADSAVQATAMAKQANHRIVLVSMVTIGLAFAIALLTAASVANPVKRLIRATRRVARQEGFTHVPRGGIRELDQLAAAFNDMSDRLAAAQRGVEEHRALLEQRVAERTEQLRHLAYHDALTQLPNRRHLHDRLTAMLEGARREGHKVALLLIDIDNFKILNDALGHLFGDRALQAVGARLAETLPPASLAARLGGDEFTVAIELQNGRHIEEHARTLLAAFAQPLHIAERDVLIGVSIGGAVFPDHAFETEALLSAADGALFKAKAMGRNRACIADQELLNETSNRFGAEQALRRALQCDELELFYQPQMSLADGRVNGVESLLRWKRNGSFVQPLDFLPLAEQLGLIADMTNWALQKAIEQLAAWRGGPWPQARVAVNVSAQQLIDRDFPRRLQNLLNVNDVPAAAIELELTENVLQTDTATLVRLDELRRLGIGIALDDFGAGFSSLASLEQLPVSRVKIDRSLIDNIDRNSRSASIAKSIIALCRSLRLNVTVEGVERHDQLRFLQQCDHVDVQGYLLARPLGAAQLLDTCNALPLRLKELLSGSPAADVQRADNVAILHPRRPPRMT